MGSTDKSKATKIIDSDHMQVHDRQLLYAYEIQEALADDATIDMYLNVDSAFEAHMRIIAGCGGDAIVTIEKYSVVPTNPLSQFIVFLRKYQKIATTAAKTKIYGTVTGGTKAEVFSKGLPGGTGGNAIGGEGGNEAELIFEEGFWYHVSITNKAGTAKLASLELEFYELAEVENDDGNYRNTDLDSL